MSPYDKRDTFNFDERSCFPEFTGSYSIHSPEITNMPTGNQKKQLTMACFISAVGEMILSTFLDKHVNHAQACLGNYAPIRTGDAR